MKVPSPRSDRARWSAPLLALLWVAAVGCGDSEPQRPGAATPQQHAQTPPPPSEVEGGEDYGEVGEAGTLPEGFPEELLVPGATSTEWGAWGNDGKLVAFASDRQPEGVYEHFVDGLPGAGWKIGQSEVMDMGDPETRSWEISATRASQQLYISITATEGGSDFAIAIKTKP